MRKDRTGSKIISAELARRDRLEQLAEEAAELSKAALKTIRAEKLSENPTPVTAEQAHNDLKEEFMDVLMTAETLGLFPEEVNAQAEAGKWTRWIDRIRKAREKK